MKYSTVHISGGCKRSWAVEITTGIAIKNYRVGTGRFFSFPLEQCAGPTPIQRSTQHIRGNKMKTIERFGGWICEKGWLYLVAFTFIVVATLALNTKGKSVTLRDKEWQCVIAVPDGISTRCTQYSVKSRPGDRAY